MIDWFRLEMRHNFEGPQALWGRLSYFNATTIKGHHSFVSGFTTNQATRILRLARKVFQQQVLFLRILLSEICTVPQRPTMVMDSCGNYACESAVL